jgi:hypothetical protein
VPNGLAWHPDWESCIKMHECAAQRPSLPRLTMPIPPIGTLTPLAPWGPAQAKGLSEPSRPLLLAFDSTSPIQQYPSPARWCRIVHDESGRGPGRQKGTASCFTH